MRLIDADALTERMYKLLYEPNYTLPAWNTDILHCIETAPTVSGWVSVKDRLPEKGHIVIVARKCQEPGKKEIRYVETASMYGDNEWVSIEDEYKAKKQYHMKPYAWMPLPKPPKEDDDAES